MREEGFRRAIRLQLLALVLALLLTWYAMNPAPGTVRADRGETEPPDENRREAKPVYGASAHPSQEESVISWSAVNPSSQAEEVDELEWPEVINIP